VLELVFLELAGIIQVLRIDCRKLSEGHSFTGNSEMWRNDCSSECIVISYMIIRNITGMQSDRWWESLFMEEHTAFNFQV
jgi:hypothetical protein